MSDRSPNIMLPKKKMAGVIRIHLASKLGFTLGQEGAGLLGWAKKTFVHVENGAAPGENSFEGQQGTRRWLDPIASPRHGSSELSRGFYRLLSFYGQYAHPWSLPVHTRLTCESFTGETRIPRRQLPGAFA